MTRAAAKSTGQRRATRAGSTRTPSRQRRETVGAEVVEAHDPAAAMLEQLHWRLFRILSGFRCRDDEQVAAGLLTLTQCSVLHTLRERGRLRRGELASIERVKGPTITQAVGRLEDLGLVRRVRGEDDRRVTYIEITAKGVRAQRAAVRDLFAGILSDLNAAQLVALDAALQPLERAGRAAPGR